MKEVLLAQMPGVGEPTGIAFLLGIMGFLCLAGIPAILEFVVALFNGLLDDDKDKKKKPCKDLHVSYIS